MERNNLFSAHGEVYHIKDITSIGRIEITRLLDSLKSPSFHNFRSQKKVYYYYRSFFKVFINGRSIKINSKFTEGNGEMNYTENYDTNLNDTRESIIDKWNAYKFNKNE